jgi:hypothetical protein
MERELRGISINHMLSDPKKLMPRVKNTLYMKTKQAEATQALCYATDRFLCCVEYFKISLP